jgi:exonuclease VII small subunit
MKQTIFEFYQEFKKEVTSLEKEIKQLKEQNTELKRGLSFYAHGD